ncbi:hypothetical protein D3C80_1789750 [compost metagenome]
MLTFSSLSLSSLEEVEDFTVAFFTVEVFEVLALAVSFEYSLVAFVVSDATTARFSASLSSAHFWQASLSSLQETKMVQIKAMLKKKILWFILLANFFMQFLLRIILL